jgi:hypothetical protein
MANYRDAKAELFRRLTDPTRQRAVINVDGPRDPDERSDHLYKVFTCKVGA